MLSTNSEDIVEQAYEYLAKAIVIQAADDYKRYRFVLDTIDLRNYKNEEGKYIAMTRANKEIKNVECFFKSAWFHELSHLDGCKAMVGLEETYLNEYYPIRLEEMLDGTKNARFRTKCDL